MSLKSRNVNYLEFYRTGWRNTTTPFIKPVCEPDRTGLIARGDSGLPTQTSQDADSDFCTALILFTESKSDLGPLAYSRDTRLQSSARRVAGTASVVPFIVRR